MFIFSSVFAQGGERASIREGESEEVMGFNVTVDAVIQPLNEVWFIVGDDSFGLENGEERCLENYRFSLLGISGNGAPSEALVGISEGCDIDWCGDGDCDEDEDCGSCEEDCGCGEEESCVEGLCEEVEEEVEEVNETLEPCEAPEKRCGDGRCGKQETWLDCCYDCRCPDGMRCWRGECIETDGCESESDCGDGDPCTRDLCRSGECKNVAFEGCALGQDCLSEGAERGGEFCDGKGWREKGEGKATCSHDYECESGSCLAGLCYAPPKERGLFSQAAGWLRGVLRLFL